MKANLFPIVASCFLLWQSSGAIFFSQIEESCKVDCEGDGTGKPMVKSIPLYCMFIKLNNPCKKSLRPERIIKHITNSSEIHIKDLNASLQTLQDQIAKINNLIDKKSKKNVNSNKHIVGLTTRQIMELTDLKETLESLKTKMTILSNENTEQLISMKKQILDKKTCYNGTGTTNQIPCPKSSYRHFYF